MNSPVVFEVILTISIATVMSFIAFVWLSRLFSLMKITRKQVLKTLPTALILPAILLMFFFLFNPQHVNMAEPLTYAWELIFFSVLLFLVTCRTFFLHFGKKNVENNRREKNEISTI